MRKSSIFLFILILDLILFIFMIVHSFMVSEIDVTIEDTAAFAKKYTITDLCLFTEARYTRHISMADYHAPFQDFPLSFEHFPSGSLVRPPHSLYNEMD